MSRSTSRERHAKVRRRWEFSLVHGMLPGQMEHGFCCVHRLSCLNHSGRQLNRPGWVRTFSPGPCRAARDLLSARRYTAVCLRSLLGGCSLAPHMSGGPEPPVRTTIYHHVPQCAIIGHNTYLYTSMRLYTPVYPAIHYYIPLCAIIIHHDTPPPIPGCTTLY